MSSEGGGDDDEQPLRRQHETGDAVDLRETGACDALEVGAEGRPGRPASKNNRSPIAAIMSCSGRRLAERLEDEALG